MITNNNASDWFDIFLDIRYLGRGFLTLQATLRNENVFVFLSS